MGEEAQPQTLSPDYDLNVVAQFLDGLDGVAVLERATTFAVETKTDFRLEINCQKGNHYMRVRRFRGTKRRKNSGTDGKESYMYLGDAKIVAHERQGIYETRWQEFQYNHTCHYS